MKKLPTVGGGYPLPTPYTRSVAKFPRAWSLRSLANIAPPNVLAHYTNAVCTRLHHSKLKSAKATLPWEGGHPPPTPSLRSVAKLPWDWSLRSLAKIERPKLFWLITPHAVCTRLHHFKLKSAKAPYPGRGRFTVSHPPPSIIPWLIFNSIQVIMIIVHVVKSKFPS